MSSKVFGNGDNNFNKPILYHIMLVMPLSDLSQFSRTCWTIYEISKIVHRIRRFENLSTSAPKLLHEFVTQVKTLPSIARCVKNLSYSSRAASARGYSPHFVRASTDITQFLINHTWNSNFIANIDKEEWCRNIQELEFMSLSTLVSFMTVCPALEELDYRGRFAELHGVVHQVMNHCYLNVSMEDPPFDDVEPFRSLRSINLFRDDVYNCEIALHYLICISSIPSLQRLALSGLTVTGKHASGCSSESDQPRTSNLQRLTLDSCIITPLAISHLLGLLPKLELLRMYALGAYWRYCNKRYRATNHPFNLSYGVRDDGNLMNGTHILDVGTSCFVGEIWNNASWILDERNLGIVCTEVSHPAKTWVIDVRTRQLSSLDESMELQIKPDEVVPLAVRSTNAERIFGTSRNCKPGLWRRLLLPCCT